MTTVGIPRALLFWSYAPLWLGFFRSLGLTPVVSRETTRETMDRGVRLAVDEACLPVKVFFGHCAELAETVDWLFVPRLVSVERRKYICPKFMGLPDMVRQPFGDRTRLLDPVVDFLKAGPDALPAVAGELGKRLGVDGRTSRRALDEGLAALRRLREQQERGVLPEDALAGQGWLPVREAPPRPCDKAKLTVGVLGHPYNVHDRQISFGLVDRLAGWGVKAITGDNLPAETCRAAASELPKDLFWTLGWHTYGAAVHFMSSPGVAGLIHLVSFGCGPDSLVGELVRHRAEAAGTPFLLITLDEHTGEAGFLTRVEAFVDMLERRGAVAGR
ncbi:MAG: acyl-CoA dehydratase activase-related protein [Chitinophagales bacterium]